MPPGLATGVLTGTSLAGKKLGLKAIPGLLAMPAVSFLMLFAAFFGVVRALRAAGELAQEKGESPKRGAERALERQQLIVAWWKRHRLPATLSLGVLVLLVLFNHSVLAIAIVLLSMLVVALLLLELARAGLANRTDLGRTLGHVLHTTGVWWCCALFWPGPISPSEYTGPVILFYGALLCLVASEDLTWKRVKEWIAYPIRLRYPDPITVACLRVLSVGLLLYASALAIGGLLFICAALRPIRAERDPIVDWVETFDAEAWSPDWMAFDSTVLSLRTLETPLDLRRAERPLLRATLDSSPAVLRFFATPVRVALLSEADLRTLIGPSSDAEVLFREHGQDHALVTVAAGLELGLWSSEQRAALARELTQLEATDKDLPLSLRTCGDLLRSLGHPEQSDLDTMVASVALLIVGVPDSAEPEDARSWIQSALRFKALPLQPTTPDAMQLAASLLELDRQLGPRPLLRSLVGLRLEIGALMLVLLCLIAIRASPRRSQPEAGA